MFVGVIPIYRKRRQHQFHLRGGLAQLVERLLCTEKVSGSNPLASSKSSRHAGETTDLVQVKAELHIRYKAFSPRNHLIELVIL